MRKVGIWRKEGADELGSWRGGCGQQNSDLLEFGGELLPGCS
jgi:hypothetical protein